MRAWPSIQYCHSLVLGCQCSSRIPPGLTSTSDAAIVRETGNTLESVIRTVPLLVLIGCCAVILWLNLCGTAVMPLILSELGSRHWGGEDVTLAGVGRVAEERGRHSKIFAQHLARHML